MHTTEEQNQGALSGNPQPDSANIPESGKQQNRHSTTRDRRIRGAEDLYYQP
jgi:hypothetical protein